VGVVGLSKGEVTIFIARARIEVHISNPSVCCCRSWQCSFPDHTQIV